MTVPISASRASPMPIAEPPRPGFQSHRFFVHLISFLCRGQSLHFLTMKSAELFSPSRSILAFVTTALLFPLNLSLKADAEWQPAKGPLMTRWAKDVSPKNAHPEYPRPQMIRKDWLNLNGLWDYAIVPKSNSKPAQFDGKILVPFPVESALSGVMKRVGEANRLWYRRAFKIPSKWKSKRVVLNFGAVDWETTVWVNGKEIGSHRGGYDGFNFDITEALKSSGDQEIVVAVFDPTDAGTQPRGKQVNNPHSIWYTPTTGIWQTVWLEPVDAIRIESLKITPDFDGSAVAIGIAAHSTGGKLTLRTTVRKGRSKISSADVTVSGREPALATPRVVLNVPKAHAWTPDDPFLYDLELTLLHDGKKMDQVTSYFGMRKISLAKDDKGVLRLCLNNKSLFQFGPLDQGFWPDGIYTAPTDEALRYDIEATKKLGFNTARKHVKIEPDRWYYWCDKLGLLVWQDMPSGDKYIRNNEPDITRSPESGQQYERELKALVAGRENHPCIVMWVPYNEGWGQWETAGIVDLIKKLDPTRLVNNTSGWTDRGVGDVNDIHSYPGPAAPKPESQRAGVLGEFGGLGLPMRGHTWQAERNWGYRSFTNAESLSEAYLGLIKKLRPMIGTDGLSAAIYTQTTDVEIEVNGLMTYDRALIKMNAEQVAAANRKVYLPPPPPSQLHTLSPTSQENGIEWRYTTSKPPENWSAADFDDSAWPKGQGGFGEPSTPGSVVRTQWKTGDIWIRREFVVPSNFRAHSLQLMIHHDEDAEIFVNGKLVANFQRYIGSYDLMPLDSRIKDALRPGKNSIAVHCHQTTGGQYIDVGLVDVIEAGE